MNTEQKKKTIQNLATGREKLSEIFMPEGVVIVHKDGFKCLDGNAPPELCDRPLFSVNTRIGERLISWNQLQKVRGEDQTLIFLPDNGR